MPDSATDVQTFLSLSQLSERLDGSYVASSDLTMRPAARGAQHEARAAYSARRTLGVCGDGVVQEDGELLQVAAGARPVSPARRFGGGNVAIPRALLGKLQLALGFVAACIQEAAALGERLAQKRTAVGVQAVEGKKADLGHTVRPDSTDRMSRAQRVVSVPAL